MPLLVCRGQAARGAVGRREARGNRLRRRPSPSMPPVPPVRSLCTAHHHARPHARTRGVRGPRCVVQARGKGLWVELPAAAHLAAAPAVRTGHGAGLGGVEPSVPCPAGGAGEGCGERAPAAACGSCGTVHTQPQPTAGVATQSSAARHQPGRHRSTAVPAGGHRTHLARWLPRAGRSVPALPKHAAAQRQQAVPHLPPTTYPPGRQQPHGATCLRAPGRKWAGWRRRETAAQTQTARCGQRQRRRQRGAATHDAGGSGHALARGMCNLHHAHTHCTRVRPPHRARASSPSICSRAIHPCAFIRSNQCASTSRLSGCDHCLQAAGGGEAYRWVPAATPAGPPRPSRRSRRT